MKTIVSKILLSFALVFVAFAAASAQPINMGASPINFGTGCNSSFIQNSTSNAKISFGINEFCLGGGMAFESIVMDVFNNRLGIGVLSPTYQLQLATNSAAKPGSSSWTVASDRRLKSDVKGFSDGLATVRGIKPVTFHYNATSGYDSKPEYVGVLAQELQEVAPYMVSQSQITDATGKATDYLAVDFGAMDFVLVNAVKELDADLQAQKAENVELHAVNEVMQTAIAELRSEIAALKSSQGQSSTLVLPALQVAPNPAGDMANLTFTLPAGTRIASVHVIGIDGMEYATKPIPAATDRQLTLNTQDYPAGTYILKLVADGKTVATSRLVTQH